MLRYYDTDAPRVRWWPLGQRLLVIAGLVLLLAAASLVLAIGATRLAASSVFFTDAANTLSAAFGNASLVLLIVSLFTAALAAVLYMRTTTERRIASAVARAIGDPSRGNPLHLSEGQVLPRVACEASGMGYVVSVAAYGTTTDRIEQTAAAVSSALRGRLSRFAVVRTEPDIAFNDVRLYLEDMTMKKRIEAASVDDLLSDSPYLLTVQNGTAIDLRTSGHMLVAGRTRSGKTTAVVSLLLQVLHHQGESGDGEVIVVDPKSAELSTLPRAVKPDEDGGGRAILEAMRGFERLRKERQAKLNELQAEKGDAVHWWDAGMSVSVLFIDEYITCRSLFPTRAAKDDPDYCQRTFDDLLKSLITQGASAGCYIILSVAQPSVGEGGIPSLVREACTTRILFRPSLADARLMWSTEEVGCVTERRFSAGDAWFTSTDGKHDAISFVQFPDMGQMRPYAELRRALSS